MSNLSQFVGGVESRSPATIINGFSDSPFTPASVKTDLCKEILSGALTATTLATVLSVTGAGVVGVLSILPVDTTSRTIRLQVVIDGVTVFDSTSTTVTSSTQGAYAIGSVSTTNTYSWACDAQIPFNSSFVVKVASSLTETDKVKIGVRYRTV